jgi:Domain of unknown function (DUF4169)
MADVINLRTARKRAKREQDQAKADANRLAHGQPKTAQKLAAARQTKADRDLEQHRIKGDGR